MKDVKEKVKNLGFNSLNDSLTELKLNYFIMLWNKKPKIW